MVPMRGGVAGDFEAVVAKGEAVEVLLLFAEGGGHVESVGNLWVVAGDGADRKSTRLNSSHRH